MRRRVLIAVVLTIASAACVVLLVWLLPSWLTRYPRVGGIDRHTAIANTRNGLVALVVATGAVGSLAYTVRTYRLTRRGQISDRYTKAIEQLDNQHESICIGGIFALEQVVRESEVYRQTVLSVLNAYIRDRRPASSPPGAGPIEEPPHDVVIALQVMERLQTTPRTPELDFRRTNLAHTDLSTMSLVDVQFAGADLRNAELNGADLRGADLRGAALAGARFYRADLKDAQVHRDQLEEGQLAGVRNLPHIIELPEG